MNWVGSKVGITRPPRRGAADLLRKGGRLEYLLGLLPPLRAYEDSPRLLVEEWFVLRRLVKRRVLFDSIIYCFWETRLLLRYSSAGDNWRDGGREYPTQKSENLTNPYTSASRFRTPHEIKSNYRMTYISLWVKRCASGS